MLGGFRRKWPLYTPDTLNTPAINSVPLTFIKLMVSLMTQNNTNGLEGKV
jgi:hypothetical protein